MSRNRISTTRRIAATLMSALLFCASATRAVSLDEHIGQFSQAVRDRNPDKALNGLRDMTDRMLDLYGQAKKIKDAGGVLTDSALKISNVLAMYPSQLGWLEEDIKKDSAFLKSVQPKAPTFGDPLQHVSTRDLQSSDLAIRNRALEQVTQQGRQLRDAFEAKLARLEDKRAVAQKILKTATEADFRSIEVTRILDDINAGPAGVLFNIGGAQLAYTLVDMVAFIQPATAERVNEARYLVQRYDVEINQMRRTLDLYAPFDDLASFHRSEAWVDALKKMERAEQRSQQTEGAFTVSELQSRLQKSREEMISKMEKTSKRAAELLREASRMDAKAAAMNQYLALGALAAAVSNAGSDEPAQQAPQQSAPQGPSIQLEAGTSVLPEDGTQPPVAHPDPR